MSKAKKILIIFFLLMIFIVLCFIGFYFYGLSPVSSSNETVTYKLSSGTSKLQIADNLKEQGIIKSSVALKIYLFLHSDLTLQAGNYEFTKNMSAKEIISNIASGKVKNDEIKITLIEGRRLEEYVKTISNSLEITEEELYGKMRDSEYLSHLIEKYWFLDESILNQELYYPLEGYLFPDTYTFYQKSTAEEIFEKILDHTEKKLDTVKTSLEGGNHTAHEILSMASIIELEAVNENDRKTVSQVIQKRLDMGKGLGMDVTTYYAVKKEMGTGLTLSDLKTVSPYNTSESNSSMAGKLPVGPICNPSLMSIEAALNPTDTDYLYFYADVKTGMVYFTHTYEEHLQIQNEIG